MPAVLRPNEYPSSPAVPKASPTGEELDDDERVVRSSGSFTSLSGILSLSRLSRRSTGDSGKVVDWDWDLSNYPKVDGQPTRRHWKVRTAPCDAMRLEATHERYTSTNKATGGRRKRALHPTCHNSVSSLISRSAFPTMNPTLPPHILTSALREPKNKWTSKLT